VGDTQKIQLWAQDYSKVLFETECPWGAKPRDAEDFLRASGYEWLGLVVQYGVGWKERWSGCLELKPDGTTEAHQDTAYMTYMDTRPAVDDASNPI
jgi:hypothetical protein